MSQRLTDRVEDLEKEKGIGTDEWILHIILWPSQIVKFLMKGKENSIGKSEFVRVVR